MEVRKNVKLEGIPICWHTNLSDDEVRQLYEILKDDPDLSDCKIEVRRSFPIVISCPALFSKAIPFKEGWCECYGLEHCLRVIYRSAKDWDLWNARQREIEEFWDERNGQFNINKLLFEVEDESLAQDAKDSLVKKEFKIAASLIEKRMLHAKRVEELNRAQGFRHFNVIFWTRRDSLQILTQFPAAEYAIRFLREHAKFWWDYYSFGKNYFFSNCQGGKAPIEETDKVFRAAVHDFPQEGKLYKNVCLFWKRENQINLAIEYCRLACDRGLRDNTQKGFPFRLKRLQRMAGQIL
jgi:hypothetical protein